MPTITIRLSADEKADLESAARRSGKTLSEYVRETLTLRGRDVPARVEALEAQVRALTYAAQNGRGHVPDF